MKKQNESDTSYIGQVYRGKTLGRVLFNDSVRAHRDLIQGSVLDIASGGKPSYLPLIPESAQYMPSDIVSGTPLDMNKALPFEAGSFDTVLLFNALYIAEDPVMLGREIQRVLKPGGFFLCVSPFVQAEIPEPHDYRRFTQEGLLQLFAAAGFGRSEVKRVGGRFCVAANTLHDFWVFNTVRLCVYGLAIWLDRFTVRFQQKYPFPLAYFCVVRK